MNKNFIEIRRYLHQNPELSEKEKNTASYIKELYSFLEPDQVFENVGGHGLIFGFDTGKKGKSVVFRCELDALPIKEKSDLPYKSSNEGIAHLCGHDGHMTILYRLATLVKENIKGLSGKIYFLYQSAEENAAGAKEVVKDDRFKEIKPDYIYALHNIPGQELGSVISKKGGFASASTGLVLEFEGKTSHAAHPENSINPVSAMTNTIDSLLSIPFHYAKFTSAAAVNVIHAKLGEIAFGTTPGDAVVRATLRAHLDSDIERMINKAKEIAQKNADAYGLKLRTELVDYFPATKNHDNAYENLKQTVEDLQLKYIEKTEPFSWSEDFGFFSNDYETAMFGLGSGVDHAQLHNPDYDFPDDLIEIGSDIFYKLLTQTNL